jgi:hypothetical protein
MKIAAMLLVLVAGATAQTTAYAIDGRGGITGDAGGPVIFVGANDSSDETPGSNATHHADVAGQERPFVYEAVPHQSGGFTLEHLATRATRRSIRTVGRFLWGWRYTVYKRDRDGR